MKKVIRPLGNLTPWVWSIELVRGCNLACFHCTARIQPGNGKVEFMSREDLRSIAKIMEEVTPGRRLELAQSGEPTLHPELLDLLRDVRSLSPSTQLQVTTNGLNFLNGKYTFRDFFEAGANTIYVDMYAPRERFIKMAEEAGEDWYYYNDHKIGRPGHRFANTYYGDTDKMRLIILQDNPHNRITWRKMGKLSTFLNHLDWKASMPFGLVPVRKPYKRKCNMTQRIVAVTAAGHYVFCCIDFAGESAGKIGHVSEGPEGFKRFWLGRYMNSIRRHLRRGDRDKVPYCSRCNCAFSKCDFVMWPDEAVEHYYAGDGQMAELPEESRDDEIFAEAWQKTREVQDGLPSLEEEAEAVKKSKRKLVILSTAAVDRDARRAAGIYDTEPSSVMEAEARKGKFHGIERDWTTGPLASQSQHQPLLFDEEQLARN